jgi:7,8-dihydropterin-6-yl-methyl-4-(beta-D-ribofuranosyl)aminobenzene 5'-phosphate synthase
MHPRLLVTLLVLSMAVPVVAAEAELLNVYDAFGSANGAKQHFGFSAVVKRGELTILFDSGADADIFASNLKALGVDPREIDIAVASHNHADHISGFDYLLEVNPGVRLYLPHDFVLGAPVQMSLVGTDPAVIADLPPEQVYYGGDFEARVLTTSGRFHGANVEFVREGKEIAPGVRSACSPVGTT